MDAQRERLVTRGGRSDAPAAILSVKLAADSSFRGGEANECRGKCAAVNAGAAWCSGREFQRKSGALGSSSLAGHQVARRLH
jgi:hypothetical protein